MTVKQPQLIPIPPKTERYVLKLPDGTPLDEAASCLQKAIRRGREDRALYFAHQLMTGGFHRYLWKRLSVIAVEDIGLADTQTPILISTLCELAERHVGKDKKSRPEPLYATMATLYLCRAPKNREVDYAAIWIKERVRRRWKEEPEDIDLDLHTDKGKERLNDYPDSGRIGLEEFFYRGSLLSNPVSVGEDKYKKRVWELLKLKPAEFNKTA